MSNDNTNSIILIVDDNIENLKVLADILEHDGYTVHIANNGADALRSVSVIAPHIILLDILMPEMNGYEVCSTLKNNKNTANIPVLFLSALSETSDLVKAFEVGGLDYIVKPFVPEIVLARVRTHIELYRTKQYLENTVIKRTAELQESEQLFREIFNLSFGFIGLLSPDGRLVMANNTALKFVDVELKDVVNLPFWETPWWNHSPESKSRMFNAIQQASEGEIVRFESTHKANDGSIRNMDVSIKPIFDESQNIQFFIAEGRDITEQKAINEKYKKLYGNLIDGFVMVELNGTIIEFNEEYRKMLGYDLTELNKLTYNDLTPQKWHQYETNIITNQALVRGYTDIYEKEYRRKDGTIFPIELRANVFYDNANKPYGMWAIVRDISERKKQEKTILEEKQRAETYLQVAEVILVAFDAEAKITLLNRKGYQTLGYDQGSLEGQNWFRVCLPAEEYDDVIGVFNKIMSSEIKLFEYYENHIVTKTGEKRLIAWHNTEVKDTDGKIIGTLSSGEDITERKKVEELSQLLSNTIDIARDAAYWIDINGNFVYVNDIGSKMLGYTKAELLSLKIYDINPNVDFENWKKTFKKIKTNQTFSVESLHKHKNGKLIPVELSSTYINVNNKEYINGFARDITERKRAEQELIHSKQKTEESESQLRAIIDNAIYPITITTAEGILLFSNATARKYFEVETESLSEIKVKDFWLDPSQREVFIGKIKEQGKAFNFEAEYITKKNIVKTALNSTHVITYNGTKALFSIFYDITERKRADILMKQNEALLTNQNQLLEEKVKERTYEIESLNEELRASNEELYVNNEEQRSLNDSLEVQKMQLENTLETLKTTQNQLIQSEKMASLGVLLAGIAHEINNPITFINSGIYSLKGNISSLVEHIKHLPENVQNELRQSFQSKYNIPIDEYFTILNQSTHSIEVGVERTTEIVRSLRVFARTDEKTISQFDVNENIDTTLVILHHNYKNHIEIVRNFGSVPPIYCIAGQINQVFMNILSNAIQSINNIGCITITTENMKNKEVKITFKDNGCGIPKNIISKIYDPFFTTKEVGKGNGLGLSIVFKIIEEHKGRIEVESKESEGTEFRIYLPINLRV